MTPMRPEPGRWHPSGRSTDEDLQILADGGETGWWDESGRPAPWPQDFLDPTAGWTTAHGPHSDLHPHEDDPDTPPF